MVDERLEGERGRGCLEYDEEEVHERQRDLLRRRAQAEGFPRVFVPRHVANVGYSNRVDGDGYDCLRLLGRAAAQLICVAAVAITASVRPPALELEQASGYGEGDDGRDKHDQSKKERNQRVAEDESPDTLVEACTAARHGSQAGRVCEEAVCVPVACEGR